MSLVKTLAKVAIGVAAYKGVKGMMQQRAQGQGSASTGSLGGGLGGLLGRVGGKSGGLDQIIAKAGRSGGLGGILAGAGLGGILGGGTSGGFGEKIAQAQARGGEPDTPPSAEEEAVAALLLRAMIQAAKADGRIDATERRRILGEVDNASREEMDFLLREFEAPLDVPGLAQDTPAGLEPEVYAAALMAIDVDHPQETAFLRKLGAALELDETEIAAIHREAGVPPLTA